MKSAPRRRRRLISGVVVVTIAVVLGYFSGAIVPPGPIQWLQTRSQASNYDAYPKPDGMERIGIERYTLTHDTLGPRAGRVRYIYSIPAGWTGRELITWLREAAPPGLLALDDTACAERASSSRPAPTTTAPETVDKPTPPSLSGPNKDGAMSILDWDTSVTLLPPDGGWDNGLTFRLRRNTAGPKPASLDDGPLGVSPDEDIVVVADHPRLVCG